MFLNGKIYVDGVFQMNKIDRIIGQVSELETLKKQLHSELDKKNAELDSIISASGDHLDEVLSGRKLKEEQKIRIAILGRETRKIYETLAKIDDKIYLLNQKKNLVLNKGKRI